MKYIEVDSFLASLTPDPIECPGCPEPEFLREMADLLREAPAADVVPVVRCKNCTHYNAGYECLIDGYGVERDPEWFCGDGERKDGKDGEADGTDWQTDGD